MGTQAAPTPAPTLKATPAPTSSTQCTCTRHPTAIHHPPDALGISNASFPPCFQDHAFTRWEGPWREPCFGYDLETGSLRKMPSTCLKPSRGADNRGAVFLIGDSTATQYVPSLRKAVRGLRVIAWLASPMKLECWDPAMDHTLCLVVEALLKQE